MNINKEYKELMEELHLANITEVIEEYIEYEKLREVYPMMGFRFRVGNRYARSGGVDIQHAQIRLILRHARCLGLI